MAFSVLCVCTANICRSPMMEVSFRRLTVGDDEITVHSAGSRGSQGRPADPTTVTVAAGFNLDLAAHASQPLTRELVDAADLILCAEVEHLLSVVDKSPGAFAKTFLLLELAAEPARRRHDETLTEWVARNHTGRTPGDVMKTASRFALSDPYKQGNDKIRRAATQIVDATESIASSWT